MIRSLLTKIRKTLGDGSNGFTMIELLVVIAIIGILAVAVLSSLNPIEQINRGRDTRTRADASELLGAVERYYTTRELYPWNTVAATLSTSAFASNVTSGSWTSVAAWPDELVTANEIKPALPARLAADQKHYVLKDAGAATSVLVCFQPISDSFQNEALENCTSGVTPDSVNGQNLCTTGSEFICLP